MIVHVNNCEKREKMRRKTIHDCVSIEGVKTGMSIKCVTFIQPS